MNALNLANVWESCRLALSKQKQDNATRMTLKILRDIQKLYPNCPPTCIIAEPTGGWIIERRIIVENHEYISELTIYHDLKVDFMRYKDGKVIDLKSIDNSIIKNFILEIKSVDDQIKGKIQ